MAGKNLRKPPRVARRKTTAAVLLAAFGCGVFYTACLLGASLLAGGEVNWQGSNAMLPIALLLGGLLGSAVTALRTNR